MQIELADPQLDGLADELALLLVDSVAGGASVGFLHPLTTADAARFWRGALSSEGTLTWVARDDDGSAMGVVQLRPVPYPNGAHRADVAKLLVHSTARERGIARALMSALEAEALRRGRWLLVLDTESGSRADTLYQRWGWQRFGLLPDHAALPDGRLAPTAYLFKRLQHPPAD